ncbi:acetyl-CoA carboxylase biotin carboxyl carrier protein [Ornithinibacillus halophilus]|uniref:Biotin carboxyl carrier protein of acetyl-CoA carboxylase n=1 Tax=Ornithinibacillus halophilus TaxID=930117 RepID=A0A1M5CYF5_9BACI|nr:acetyl-CoA carboxylase biotin carboxyl carrier protein [Ornithinibacillus halophilus]SHF59748.1 acetyl-CoA carboxylase biotin carboxyl carrier protein [Ornithinibacillus halophilus]
MLKVQEIRELIKLIDESSINEFTYETNGTTVSMKKSLETKEVHQPVTVKQPVEVNTEETVKVESSNNVTEQDTAPTKEVENKPEEESKTYDYEITSPMVGTFYRAPNPESDPYVEVGSKVNNETIVCIVEAMKLFNEIEAETKGEITEVLVENGELVEYGQPLFRVKTK